MVFSVLKIIKTKRRRGRTPPKENSVRNLDVASTGFSSPTNEMLALGTAAFALTPGLAPVPRGASRVAVSMDAAKPVVIGLAADSGCGKSTFMRRVTGIFGGESKFNDIGRETNTLVSDMTTVICLDDYHKWDRTGRKSNPEWPDGITALHKDCQNWDKMAEDVLNLKNGVAVEKPIYNHITGELDPDETVRYLAVLLRHCSGRWHAQSTCRECRPGVWWRGCHW
jgi:hypothetical protein